ncbi:predicted protein [Chaetomium globosum CBS 148.51]|uniref:Uncharacterized protein n=1 Tax=Chaetomium globosum (strain ATCC 6205 / CBS 148.51 / DSM 1962 / NBRC 6347 / NRRL 1970) TaxID=306901 RepID=Q2H5W6_CHAGB|nr:uncharacterized protein CHGG_05949 [Chaetomium globosum CBS 148.51]EAQ89330.1 predicted protein [Chaetomium globosum CBS 148.51]
MPRILVSGIACGLCHGSNQGMESREWNGEPQVTEGVVPKFGSKISGLSSFSLHISEPIRCESETEGGVVGIGGGGGDGPAPVSGELACRTCAGWGRYDVLNGGGPAFLQEKADLNTLAQMRTFPTDTDMPPYLPTKCASPIHTICLSRDKIYRNKPGQVRRTRLVYGWFAALVVGEGGKEGGREPGREGGVG